MVTAAAALTACVGTSEAGRHSAASSTGTTFGGTTEATAAEGSSEDTGPTAPADACAKPTDVSAAPQTIGEAIDFINALPHPVALDCFLQQLARPLAITSTTSTVSLQPAVGTRSPRLFLFFGELIMSVAIDGEPGNHLLEFGELITPTQSIKGEIAFPVHDILSHSAPMDRVLDPGKGSECRICHGGEDPAPQYANAFSSDALQFRPFELVALDDVADEQRWCDPAVEPDRCARLDALFGFGPVEIGEFPEELPTIYDYE